MKKITYFLVSVFFVFSMASCEHEDYAGMNITHNQGEDDVKEFTGDLNSQIVVKNIAGDLVTEVDMGETFYVIDNTAENIDVSEWVITQEGQTITSNEQLVRLSFPGPGPVTASVTSKRSSDGKTTTSETIINVKSIPVEASFINDPMEDGGVINIYTSNSVIFTSTSKGSAKEFSWTFESPDETITSTEENPEITFLKPGIYDVTFTALRDDGSQGVSEDTIVKTGYIVVEQLVVDLIRAVATDSAIELQFTQPIAQNIPANATDEFSITINTKNGGVLTPSVLTINATGEKTVELVFGDKMYSDDEVLISFNPTGILTDASGLYNPEMISDEPCVYGHNLWTNTDTEDASKFRVSDNTAANNGIFEIVDENSPVLPMEPYQGHSCIAFTKGDDSIGISVLEGYTVAEGDVVELAYEGRRIEELSGAVERRMSEWIGSGSNDANGNWSSANSNGGLNEWITVTRTINVSANTKGKTGELFLTFLRYGGNSSTAALWIDNVRIYVPNPRP